MAWLNGTAANYRDLLRILRHFVTGRATVGSIAQTGTGNGTLTLIDPVIGAVTQTWTLACTAGGPTGTFSVTGSVSGALANATVGTSYSNAQIGFLISDGAADFVIGDQFVFTVTASTMISGERWVQDRWTDDATQEFLAHAPGLAASDAIYMGARSYQDLGVPYWFIEGGGFIGHIPANTWANQPGALSGTYWPGMSLWDTTIPFWLVANGRRAMLVAKVETRYEMLHLGFFLPYATPGQYPYPLLVGGSISGLAGRIRSLVSGDHRMFWNPGADSAGNGSCAFMLPGAAWSRAINYTASDTASGLTTVPMVLPYGVTNGRKLREGLAGDYVLQPFVLAGMDGTQKGAFGEIDGLYAVTGYGNATENIVSIGGQNHLVVQNVYRNANSEYCALKLA